MLLAGLLVLALSLNNTRFFLRSLSRDGSKVFSINVMNEGITTLGNGVFAYALVLGPIALVQSTNALHPLLLFLVVLVLTRWAPSFYYEDIGSVWKLRLIALCMFAAGVFLLRDYIV